jgi:hypothetical protein
MDGGPDTGPTPITCVDEAIGGFYSTCRANPTAMPTPGGPFDDGSYVLNGFWRNGGCGANERLDLGHMTIFHQDGHAYMRFLIDAADGGTPNGTVQTRRGTWHLASDGDGGITRIELCADGGSSTGIYERDGDGGTGSALNIKVNDYQELWVKE